MIIRSHRCLAILVIAMFAGGLHAAEPQKVRDKERLKAERLKEWDRRSELVKAKFSKKEIDEKLEALFARDKWGKRFLKHRTLADRDGDGVLTPEEAKTLTKAYRPDPQDSDLRALGYKWEPGTLDESGTGEDLTMLPNAYSFGWGGLVIARAGPTVNGTFFSAHAEGTITQPWSQTNDPNQPMDLPAFTTILRSSGVVTAVAKEPFSKASDWNTHAHADAILEGPMGVENVTGEADALTSNEHPGDSTPPPAPMSRLLYRRYEPGSNDDYTLTATGVANATISSEGDNRGNGSAYARINFGIVPVAPSARNK